MRLILLLLPLGLFAQEVVKGEMPKDFMLKCNTAIKDKLDMYWIYDANTQIAKRFNYQFFGAESGWRKNEWEFELRRVYKTSLTFAEKDVMRAAMEYVYLDRVELTYWPDGAVIDKRDRYCEVITQADIDKREQQFKEDVANFVAKKKVNKI